MLTGFLLPITVTALGIFLTLKLRGFFILHPLRTAKATLSFARDKKRRRALTLALAGTLGVGNIFGVAAGIMIGGAGSVFWLFVSSLPSMVIKYAESALSAKDVSSGGGGMHLTLSSSFKSSGAVLSKLYAVLLLTLSVSMGAIMQSASVCEVASEASIFSLGAAIAVALIFALCCFGKREKISSVTEKIIPIITIAYIILSFFAIFHSKVSIKNVVCDIVSSAFSPLAMGGGVLALLSSHAVREGFSRGLLSNEAGAGSSSLGHTSVGGKAAEAGLFGILEVFFDTTLLCTLTALVILSSGVDPALAESPMALVHSAFSVSLGKGASFILLPLIFGFAFSTVICWYYYGSTALGYLFGEGKLLRAAFFLLYIAAIVSASFIESSPILAVNDTVLFFMTLLTSAVLVLRSRELYSLTLDAGLL